MPIIALTIHPIGFWIGAFVLLITAALTLIFIRMDKRKILGMQAALGITSIVLYLAWGSSHPLSHYHALNKITHMLSTLSQNTNFTKTTAEENFQQLQTEIGYSHTALSHLSSVYKELGWLNSSIKALEEAMVLMPNEAMYQAQWIYHTASMHQGRLPDDIKQKAIEFNRQHPTEKLLINVLAIDDYLKKDYQNAIKHWQFLLNFDENLSDSQRNQMIHAVKIAKELWLQQDNLLKVPVTITLSKEVQQQIQKEDVVYIFLRAVDSQQPLGVIKRSADSLPLKVILTEADSMLGDSWNKDIQVEVVAKIMLKEHDVTSQSKWMIKSRPYKLSSEVPEIALLIKKEHSNG